MITLGKRPRPPYSKHYYPSGPGAMPNVSNRPSGPSAPPPVGSQISVQSRSTVTYLQTNPTASIPLMIRPWSEHYEKDYAPGCLIFAKQDKIGRSPLVTVADVPTLNYLFTRGRQAGGEVIGHEKDQITPNDYEFFGLFRNDAGKQVDRLGNPRYTNTKQRLIQCDVYGRAKAANFWGNKLQTGQRLGIALVNKTLSKIQEPNKYPRTLREPMIDVPQLVATVNDCLPGTTTPVTGALRHWDVGVVSQAAYEPPTKANIQLALNNSQQRTNLPQIEVLMI